MTRTLRGVWSRRRTLLPLLLLTAVVVGGTVTVVSFAAAAGTSRLLALPLLLLGLVAVPGTAGELAVARRGEIALARLRGLRGPVLLALVVAEPLVVLVAGAVLGLLLGLFGARIAASQWAGEAAVVGWQAPLAGSAIVVVALASVVAGSVSALREPLVLQIGSITRPKSASVAAIFASVAVVAAAVVAVYRSRVAGGAPDWVVLTGPALVGLACGQGVVWVVQLAARALVPLTARGGLAGFLAARRVARVAGVAAAVRVLVAAAAVAGLAITGAHQVSTWTDQTARLRAGAPLQVRLDLDADQVVELTHRLDPAGRYLMAAVVVPGTGSVPARRVFLDTARYDRVVGDFYAGTPAADVGAQVGGLGGRNPGLATGDTLTATVRGTGPRTSGTLRPRFELGYLDDRGLPAQVRVSLRLGLDGAPVTATVPLPECATGCAITRLTFLTRHSEPYPWVLTGLQAGDLDALHLHWQPGTRLYPHTPRPGPRVVADGLRVTKPTGFGGDSQTTQPATDTGGRTPILATDSAHWTGGATQVESPGGDDRSATVLARDAALPLVGRDGVLADLPRAAAGAPPTVPAAQALVLARADTPASLLAGLRAHQRGPVRTLAEAREATFRQTRSAQSRMYTLMAVCCLLVALLVLGTAAARQREGWLRDLAALRVVGVGSGRLRGSAVREVVGLVLAATIGTGVATVLAVWLLLAHLPLVHVPAHAVPLRTGVAAGPLLGAVLAAAVIVAVVAGRGRRTSLADSRPAILRDADR